MQYIETPDASEYFENILKFFSMVVEEVIFNDVVIGTCYITCVTNFIVRLLTVIAYNFVLHGLLKCFRSSYVTHLKNKITKLSDKRYIKSQTNLSLTRNFWSVRVSLYRNVKCYKK